MKTTEQLVKDLLMMPPDYDRKNAAYDELQKNVPALKNFVPQLADGLLLPDSDTRINCASLLRELKEDAVVAVPQLLARVTDPQENEHVREQAAKAVGMAGKEGLRKLNQLTDDPDEKTRDLAFEGLALGGFMEYIDTFIAHLADPSHDIRYSMQINIASNGQFFDAKVTLEKLAQKFGSLPALAKPYAASAILKLDPGATFLLPALLEFMEDAEQSPDELRMCLDAIESVKEWPPGYVNAVAKLIGHTDRKVRLWAVLSLHVKSEGDETVLRPNAADALPEMIQSLQRKTEEDEIREQICYVLAKLEHSAAPAVYALTEMIMAEPVVVELQTAAAMALFAIGPAVKHVKKRLKDFLKEYELASDEATEFVKLALRQAK